MEFGRYQLELGNYIAIGRVHAYRNDKKAQDIDLKEEIDRIQEGIQFTCGCDKA